MRRRLLSLGLAAVLALGSGSAAATPISVPALPPPATSITEGALKLEAHAEKYVAPGDELSVVVSATNTGEETLEYWLPTPCHSAFSVLLEPVNVPRIMTASAPEPADQVISNCPQVIHPIRLAPGDSLKQEFQLQTRDLSPGGYTLSAAFEAWQGEEQRVSVRVRLSLLVDGFQDIVGHWAADLIRNGLRIGFIDGYPDGSFQPQNQVTRAELVAMLVRARQLERREMDLPYFLDTAGHWADRLGYLHPAIESAVLDPTAMRYTLKPDEPLTREETAILAVRAMGHVMMDPPAGPVKPYFRDTEQIAPAALPYIEIATANGILTGYEDLTFRPHLPVTRAEAVTMVLRMLVAADLRIDVGTSFLVDGAPIAAPGLAFRAATPQQVLVPLGAVTEAAGVRTTALEQGWLSLERGEASLKLKNSLPYAAVAGGERLYFGGLTPAAVNGQIYVPAAALEALGLKTSYDPAAAQFEISTGQ